MGAWEGKLPALIARRPNFPLSPHHLLMQKERAEKVEHRDIYINYIRKSLKSRSAVKDVCTELDIENGLDAPHMVVSRNVTPRLHTASSVLVKDTIHGIRAYSSNKFISNLFDPISAEDAILTPIDLDHIYASSQLIDFGNIPPHSTKSIIFDIQNQTISKSNIYVGISVDKNGREHVNVNPNTIFITHQATGSFEVSCCRHVDGVFESSLTYVINGRYIYNIIIRANVIYIPPTLSRNFVNFQLSNKMEASKESTRKECDESSETELSTEITVDGILYQLPVFENIIELNNSEGGDIFYKVFMPQNDKPDNSFLEFGNYDGTFNVEPQEGRLVANKTIKLKVMFTPGTRSFVESAVEIFIYDSYGNPMKEIHVLPLKLQAEGPSSTCSLLNISPKAVVDFGFVPIYFKDGSDFNKMYDPSLTELSKNHCGKNPIFGRKPIKIKNSGTSGCHFIAFVVGENSCARLESHYGNIPANGTVDIYCFVIPDSEGLIEDFIVINILGGNKSFKIPIRVQVDMPRISLTPTKLFDKAVILGSTASQTYTVKNNSPVYCRLLVKLKDYTDVSINMIEPVENVTRSSSPFSIKQSKQGDSHRYSYSENYIVIDYEPMEEITFELIFSPLIERDYIGSIPLILLGSHEKLNIDVYTKGVNSPIVLSCNHIVFKDVVLHSLANASVEQYRETFSITNTTENEMEWLFVDCSDIPDVSIFLVEPKNGMLLRGESQIVTVTFAPDYARPYILNGQIISITSDVQFDVTFEGRCASPSISFEPAEIFFPIVPLGIISTYNFFIVNHGCDITEINAVISQDLRRDGIVLELCFPDGV
jgi:hypothetical protein